MKLRPNFAGPACVAGLVLTLACATETYAAEVAPFDFDANGRVDVADAGQMLDCFGGPENPAGGGACLGNTVYAADRDSDLDIDLRDWSALQLCFSGDQSANFGCAAPLGPVALLSGASGQEDELLVFTLTAFDPHSAPAEVTFTVVGLPKHGELRQSDGTSIANVPTVVTDPAGGLQYLAATNESGLAYASFAYTATSVITGLTSAARYVALDIAPVNDAPMNTTAPPTTLEDSAVTFQFTAFDPDEGDVVKFRVTEVPVSGVLYQVDENLAPQLVDQVSAGEFISHVQGYAHYVPNPNFFGTDSVRVVASDLANASFFSTVIAIHVIAVNDPPVAFAGSIDWENSFAPLIGNIQLAASDVDTLSGALEVCITSLPAGGVLRTRPGSVPVTQVPHCSPSKTYEYLYTEDLTALGFGCAIPPANLPLTFPIDAGSFTFRAFDGTDYSAEATYDLRFVYDNTAPYMTGIAAHSLVEDMEVTFTLAGEDIDGDQTAFVVLAQPQGGTLLRSDGTLIGIYPALFLNHSMLTYVPMANFNTFGMADDFVPVQITDGQNTRDCDYAISFDVLAVNDPPTITAPASIITGGTSGGTNGFSIDDDAQAGTELVVEFRALGTAASRVELPFPSPEVVLEQLTPAHVRVTGTLSAINATLANGLTFHVLQNGTFEASLEMEVHDQGNSGEGAVNPLTTLRVVPVEIPMECVGLECR